VILTSTDEIFAQLNELSRTDWRVLVGAILASRESSRADCPLPPLHHSGEFYYSNKEFADGVRLAKSTVRESMDRLMRTGFSFVERRLDGEHELKVRALVGDARKTVTVSKNGRLVRRFYVYFVQPSFMDLLAERTDEVAKRLSELSRIDIGRTIRLMDKEVTP